MLMRLTLVLLISALAARAGQAGNDDIGACARLAAVLEVADFTAGGENFTAIAEAGDEAACGAALHRLREGVKGPEKKPEKKTGTAGGGCAGRNDDRIDD